MPEALLTMCQKRNLHFMLESDRRSACEQLAKVLTDAFFLPRSAEIVQPMLVAELNAFATRMQQEALQEIADLKHANELLRRERIGEVWCWQGDGNDHPESLACPVLMSAGQLRKLLASQVGQ